MDYNDLVLKGDKQDKQFWDWLDEELAANRKKHEGEPDLNARRKKINRCVESRAFVVMKLTVSQISIFTKSLKAHASRCPVKMKMKGTALQKLPAWQRDITRAVETMNEYSRNELADHDEESDDDGGA